MILLLIKPLHYHSPSKLTNLHYSTSTPYTLFIHPHVYRWINIDKQCVNTRLLTSNISFTSLLPSYWKLFHPPLVSPLFLYPWHNHGGTKKVTVTCFDGVHVWVGGSNKLIPLSDSVSSNGTWPIELPLLEAEPVALLSSVPRACSWCWLAEGELKIYSQF